MWGMPPCLLLLMLMLMLMLMLALMLMLMLMLILMLMPTILDTNITANVYTMANTTTIPLTANTDTSDNLCDHCYGYLAHRLLDEMDEDGLAPDHDTISTLL